MNSCYIRCCQKYTKIISHTTADELFQFGLLVVAVVGLVYKMSHKKSPPWPGKLNGDCVI